MCRAPTPLRQGTSTLRHQARSEDTEVRYRTADGSRALLHDIHRRWAHAINLVTDDFAVVEERDCGCALGGLGLSPLSTRSAASRSSPAKG